jgi:4-diphosphocytidyl-2-C-methyl-D-erythritol kinase
MSKARNALWVEAAPAKVNLTLRVLGRRADGYHSLESLVVFAAGLADRLTLVPGGALALTVRGPNATVAGPVADNLVLKAARALAAETRDLKLGRFTLTKNLPAAAGIGGGSADAAAALRLLARANRLSLDDPRLRRAAKKVGADVPVCLDPRPRVMRGIGEVLSAPLAIPTFAAVLVNPGVTLATKDVFKALRLPAGSRRGRGAQAIPKERGALLAFLADQCNDLEPPAIALRPEIAQALTALRNAPGCSLARMSGSGATCFGLFRSSRAAASAARALAASNPRWWVRATVLG